MAPNLLGTSALFLAETTTTEEQIHVRSRTVLHPHTTIQKQIPKSEPLYRWQIVWRNVLGFIYLHVGGIYGMWLFLFVCQWKTFFFRWWKFLQMWFRIEVKPVHVAAAHICFCKYSRWLTNSEAYQIVCAYVLAFVAAQGITAGAHRLWAHRAYKAKLPLRIILMICQTIAFQNHIYEWVRDHRVHHKFTDTNADPHNAKRGFFFSHMGWLMVRKHKDVTLKGKTVDMSDVEADPVARFQKRFYLIMMPILCFVLPAVIPWYYWGEKWWISWYTASIFRYATSLHLTWLVNSAAHIWGLKPYDKNIGPTENFHVAIGALGEGYHNYHHVFPWDYKAAELGNYRMNATTMIIDGFARLGWAYDLKTVPHEMVKKRVKRTGDGTRVFDDDNVDISNIDHHHHDGAVWGWDDADMKPEDIEGARIYNRLEQ